MDARLFSCYNLVRSARQEQHREEGQVQNGGLIRAHAELERLARMEVPVALALRLRAMVRAVSGVVADIEAVRMELLRRHAETDAKGEVLRDERSQATFAGAAEREAFEREYAELMGAEADLTGIPRLGVAVLERAAIPIPAASLLALGELLEDDE